jgi:hypothetical protein
MARKKSRVKKHLRDANGEASRAVAIPRTTPMSQKITLSQLEHHLLAAADILRGKMDASRIQGIHLWNAVPEADVRSV